jgi:hypothetical protein
MAYLWDPLADIQNWWGNINTPAPQPTPQPVQQPNYWQTVNQPVPNQNLQAQNMVDLRQSGGMPAITPTPGPGGSAGIGPTTSSNPYGMTDQQMQDYLLGNKPISPYEQAQLDWERYKYEHPQPDITSAYQQQQLQYQQQQAAQTAAYQQQQLAWQQQQAAAQLAADKESRLATLSANPKSWLEYAALAGQTPAVQPWMKPLMPQQYGNLNVGAAIPGYQSANMTGMPDLINPSAQYMARMGPTAQQQYYGYMQADKASTPAETEWRLWSQGPTGGQNRGLTQQR